MLRRIPGMTLFALLVATLAAAQNPAPVPAPTGTWKVLLPVLGEPNQASWLIRFERTGTGWTGSVVATAEGVPSAKIENVQVQGETLSFTLKTSTLTLPATVSLGKPGDGRLTGKVTARDKPSPIVLEATRMTALDDFALAEEVLTRPQTDRETYRAALTLLALANARKATLKQVDEWARRAALAAEGFGKEQRDALLTLASYLAEQDPTAFLAVPYAEKAEKLIQDSDPPIVRKRVLRVLAIALERAGNAEQARTVRERNDAIELLRLRPFTGMAKGVVLVENFTCTQQSRCLATDLACEGLERTYKNGEVLVLNHHLSVPGPDPLAGPAGQERQRYYRVGATPTLLLNGQAATVQGGTLEEAQARYDTLATAVQPLVEKGTGMPAPKLALRITPRGEQLEVEAQVNDVARLNSFLRLRLALVEEVVEYTGANGLPRHRNVVRDFLGGSAGVALLERSSTRMFTVDLAELRKQLQTALEQADRLKPFPSRDWPLELKPLRIVAFVQNDETREILAAVTSRVAGE